MTKEANEEACFFERSLDLLAVTGLDGYFKRVNPMFMQTLGYSETELLATPFIEFVHPDDRALTLAELERVRAGEPVFCCENRYRTKAGLYCWLSWTVSPQLSQSIIYCSARDITHQKQIESTLRASEERWQLALCGTNDGIWDWNVQTNEVYFSPRWKAMLGYEEDEISNYLDEWASRVHPEDREWVMQAVQDHFDRKTPFYSTEHRVLCKDGRYKWILDRGQAIWDEAGNVRRMVGSHTDVTDRHELETALQIANITLEQQVAERTAELERANRSLYESEERFRVLADSAPVLIWVNGLSGCEFVNRAYLDFLGAGEVEVQQYDWLQFVHPDDQIAYMDSYLQAFDRREPLRTQCRLRRADGEYRWMLSVGQPRFTNNQEFLGYVGCTQDITDLKEAVAQLEKNRTLLQQQLAEIETIYQSAPIGLNVLDADLRFVRINQKLAEINGFSVEEHIGRSIRELLPDLADAAEAILRRILETGEPCLNVELRGETPAQPGIQRIWLESFLPIKDGDRVIGINTVCEEITELKRIEADLRQSEERYRTLFESMEDGFCVVEVIVNDNNTAIDYRFLEINPAFEQQTGLQQAVGKTVLELIPDLEPVWIHTYGQVALTGEPIRFENGSVAMQRWFDVYAFRIGQPENRKVAILFKDISVRKQAEDDLQQRNEHIRILYETTHDLLLADRPLTLIDEVFNKLKVIVGLDVYFNYVPDAQQQKLRLVGYSGISSRTAQDIEWLDMGEAVCGRVAQHRCQIVQTNILQSTDPIIKLVRSLGINAYACQPLISQDKLFGTLSFGSRSRTEFTQSEKNLFQAICDQIAIALERSQLMSSLQQQTKELQRVNRVKDEFLAVLSHELRTPLNPILGWAKILQTPEISLEKLHHGLTTIERNAKQQAQLIEDLLDISRIIQGKLNLNLESVNLSESILAAMETVRLAAEAKAIQLTALLDPTVGRVKGDSSRLQQVIWNLLSNAIKFTPSGGRVEIQLSLVKQHDVIATGRLAAKMQSQQQLQQFIDNQEYLTIDQSQKTYDLEQTTQYAQITVQDTGKGIHPNFLPHVFELFRQQDSSTTRQFGGLGLGLAIARQVVEAHGGTIAASSAGEGQGSTFTVQLPLMSSSSSTPLTFHTPQQLNLSQLRVLIVDDESDSLELLKIILEEEGATVTAFSSSTAVLEALQQSCYDLLISDISMPHMDGYELIQHIRSLQAHPNHTIPAIAVTAHASDFDCRQALAKGFQAHLAKPINIADLLEVITSLISA